MRAHLMTTISRPRYLSGIFSILFSVSLNLEAAPGVLSDVPLYMGTGAKPNVLWVVDDSGSMAGEVLKRQTGDDEGYPVVEVPRADDYYVDGGDVDTSPESKEELLESCFGYNAMAYNPNITYMPWVDSTGADYAIHDLTVTGNDLTNVPKWPDANSAPSSGEANDTHDLSDAKYMPWNDDDNDGLFDRGECWENEDANANEDDDGLSQSGAPGFVSVFDDLTVEQQQNYVNWYNFNRRRAWVMKTVLSRVFSESEDRFGLATLKNNMSIGTEINDMSNANHKADLIDKVLNVPTSCVTPLKNALDNAGKYYHQSDNINPAVGFVGNASGDTPASPIQYSCQANYTIMVTDGYYVHDGGRGCTSYTTPTVGNVDTSAGAPYADNSSNTIADIAMKYYDSDLDENMANNVKSNNTRNKKNTQHMVTYAVAFGVEGNIDISDVEGVPRPIAEEWTAEDWPSNPGDDSPESIDDLYHATFNSRGRFFSSSDPEELQSDIEEILNAIAEETEGTAAAVGVNSTSISTDTLLFQAWFSSKDWSGELRALSFGETQISASSSSSTSGSTDSSSSSSTSGSADSSSSSSTSGSADSSSSSSTSGSTSGSTSSSSSGSVLDLETLVEEWEAGEELTARVLANTSRTLLTFSSTEDIDGVVETTPAGKGIEFKTPVDITNLNTTSGELNSTHLSDLLSHSYVAAASDQQAALANLVSWFQGDVPYDADEEMFKDEGGFFRDRTSLLGDIVSSSPQYVGAPAESYPNYIQSENNPYLTFVTAKSAREPMVYVGSNDGMLHGFRASDGHEVFAYMPELLFTTESGRGYHELAETNYAHVPYVDGTPTIRDVYVDGWKTYLVGTLNGGGKGVYVLDVTDPVAEVYPGEGVTPTPTDIVVTEFTHANLGYTFARAQIGKLNNGRWAAIFGNGYNNDGTGEASLFILYLDGTGTDFDYLEIPTGKGTVVTNSDCSNNASDCNGLSSPTILDLTGDGVIDRVYAGDVHGNMWAFDLTIDEEQNETDQDWLNKVYRLFKACNVDLQNDNDECPTGNRQPITSKPVVVAHKSEVSSSTAPNLMVMFGTGQYLTANDPADTSQQSFYAVWDAGPAYDDLHRGDLVSQTIQTQTTTVEQETITYRTIDGSSVVYDETGIAGKSGWYMNLPTSGERSVLTPLINGSLVSFVTSIPTSGVCSGGGSGWLMAVDIFSGDDPSSRIFTELSQIAAGIPLDNLSGGMITLEDKYIGADSIGDIIVIDFDPPNKRPARRASWSIIR